MLFLQNLYNRVNVFLGITGGGTAPAAPPSGGGVEDAGDAVMAGPSIWPMIFMFGAMFLAMYFLMIRPQRKREKAMREMQSGLRVGDRVLTSSGMYGKIVSVGTDAFMVEFGDNKGIRVPIRKSDVLGVKTPNMAPPGSAASSTEPMKIEENKDEKKDEN
ncbi:MAG: preprotein translocase subunit YajC [Defluviitaleaceae bacterium]|nr:preprotein translocase subunit YajC [Defluviitaleaceae bacterium]